MLSLMLIIEVTLQQYSLDFLHSFTYDWFMTGRAARSHANDCEILCFGDSLVKFGVVPRVLEQRLGRRAYNLAICGGQAPSSYFLLRRAIDSGARPKVVVIDFTPHLLGHGPKPNLRQWPEFMSMSEFVDLTWSARNGGFLASLALATLLPSVKERHEIRECLLAYCSGTTASSRAEIPAYVRNWQVNLGAQLSPNAHTAGKRFNLARWEDFPKVWSCSPVNAAYIRRFLALAAEHKIEVFWLLPPTRPDVQARRERLGVDARHERFVRSVQDEFPSVTILDGRHAEFDRSAFLDPLHLTREGAIALSAVLAEQIEPCLARGPQAGARWVKLTPPRRAEVNVRIEDIDQSKLALHITENRRAR
jgi:hypothetical protein